MSKKHFSFEMTDQLSMDLIKTFVVFKFSYFFMKTDRFSIILFRLLSLWNVLLFTQTEDNSLKLLFVTDIAFQQKSEAANYYATVVVAGDAYIPSGLLGKSEVCVLIFMDICQQTGTLWLGA